MNQYDNNYMQLQEEKLKQIIKKEKTVVAIAKELNVSRQIVHRWLNRYKRFGIDGLIHKKKKGNTVAWNRTSPEIEQLVITLAKKYWVDGVLVLCDHLQYENNITLNPSTIYRILKRNNIRYTDNYTRTKRRWKKQLYSHSIAGEELQMDTKYPFGYKKGKVIYTIIDDASRWVFAWSYSTANQDNTLDFIDKVFSRVPFKIQKIRTDNGTEFTGLRIKQDLKNRKVLHRLNTPYCPEENGKIERFHRTLNEKALRFGFHERESLDQLQYKLTLFLYYYNYKRKHRGLGMNAKSPVEKLKELSTYPHILGV